MPRWIKPQALICAHRAETIAKSPDSSFSLSATGDIVWTPDTLPAAQEASENQTAESTESTEGRIEGRLAVVGKIRIEQDWLKPVALLMADEALNGAPRQQASTDYPMGARTCAACFGTLAQS